LKIEGSNRPNLYDLKLDPIPSYASHSIKLRRSYRLVELDLSSIHEQRRDGKFDSLVIEQIAAHAKGDRNNGKNNEA